MKLWIGLALLTFGTISMLAPGLIWLLVGDRLRVRGVNAEKTPRWTARAQVIGMVAFVLGALFTWEYFTSQ